MNDKHDIEAAVPRFYDLGSSWGVFLSRGFSRDIHYRMKRPLETSRVLADLAQVREADYVLDAGCGQGGSTMFLARTVGCCIDAVTISTKESVAVLRLIQKMGYGERVHVFQENMQRTHFAPETFSVTWALESMCHVADKYAFLAEMYRVMKPSGRLVLADFFLTEAFDAHVDRGTYQRFCEGFLIPSLSTKHELLDMLERAGFQNVHYEDYTFAVSATAREREASGWMSAVMFSPLLLMQMMPRMLVANMHALIAQGKLFRHNKLSYGVIYAEK